MFSDKIKEIRESQGLTQAQMAKKLGIAASSYSAYEQGRKSPKIDVLESACKVFNVSADWLLDIKGQQPQKWSDIIKLLELMSFETSNIRPAYTASDYGLIPLKKYTAVILPGRIAYDYFRLRQAMQMFGPPSGSSQLMWENAALNSPPLSEKIDISAWQLLQNDLDDQEIHFVIGEMPEKSV